MRASAPAALLLLAACYGQERFAADYAEVTCTLYEDCGWLRAMDEWAGDATACRSETEARVRDADCSYAATAARSCVEGIARMTCDDLDAGAWPERCDDACPGAGVPPDRPPSAGDTGAR